LTFIIYHRFIGGFSEDNFDWLFVNKRIEYITLWVYSCLTFVQAFKKKHFHSLCTLAQDYVSNMGQLDIVELFV